MSHESPDELHAFLIESMRAAAARGLRRREALHPRYRPWQQRIAVVPDGDLFAALREGKASIVTDTIETFTENGIRISSGEELEADVVVTATGFDLSVLGDVAFTVDGEPVDFTERVTWRGIMISGVPNMAYVFGYFRHSWTLRVDLVGDLVCRLLAHLQDKGATMVVPTLRPEDADMQLRPWSDPENFNAGYVMRSQHILFKQGDREPWTHMLEYAQEREHPAQGRPRRRDARLPLTATDGGPDPAGAGAGLLAGELGPDHLAAVPTSSTPQRSATCSQQVQPAARRHRVGGRESSYGQARRAVAHPQLHHRAAVTELDGARGPGVEDGVGDQLAHEQHRLVELLRSQLALQLVPDEATGQPGGAQGPGELEGGGESHGDPHVPGRDGLQPRARLPRGGPTPP